MTYRPKFPRFPAHVGEWIHNQSTGEKMLITAKNKASGWRNGCSVYCQCCHSSDVITQTEEFGDSSLETYWYCVSCGARDRVYFGFMMTYGGPSLTIIRDYAGVMP